MPFLLSINGRFSQRILIYQSWIAVILGILLKWMSLHVGIECYEKYAAWLADYCSSVSGFDH